MKKSPKIVDCGKIIPHMEKKVILGSGSPRRKEILEFFTLPFIQIAPDMDEESIPFKGDPIAYGQTIALEKARILSTKYPDSLLITADTVVYLNGQVFLKPTDRKQAFSMLRALAGKEHQVFTAVCVAKGKSEWVATEETKVSIENLSDEEIRAFIEAFQPFDKAGSYAIQKGGSLIVKRIEGCYYNVMGLPVQTLRRQLLKAGMDLWDFLPKP
jgi:septum formation protein